MATKKGRYAAQLLTVNGKTGLRLNQVRGVLGHFWPQRWLATARTTALVKVSVTGQQTNCHLPPCFVGVAPPGLIRRRRRRSGYATMYAACPGSLRSERAHQRKKGDSRRERKYPPESMR